MLFFFLKIDRIAVFMLMNFISSFYEICYLDKMPETSKSGQGLFFLTVFEIASHSFQHCSGLEWNVMDDRAWWRKLVSRGRRATGARDQIWLSKVCPHWLSCPLLIASPESLPSSSNKSKTCLRGWIIPLMKSELSQFICCLVWGSWDLGPNHKPSLRWFGLLNFFPFF